MESCNQIFKSRSSAGVEPCYNGFMTSTVSGVTAAQVKDVCGFASYYNKYNGGGDLSGLTGTANSNPSYAGQPSTLYGNLACAYEHWEVRLRPCLNHKV